MAKKLSTPLPTPTVSQLFDYLEEAYSPRSREQIADDIARSARPRGPGADSDPSRETIMSYVKPRKSGKPNSETPLHHRFAHVVLNYLDGRREIKGLIKHIVFHPSHENNDRWKSARALCTRVLNSERDRRFEQPLTSDPGSHETFAVISGVYATRRRDSLDKKYHQELLILNDHGEGRASRLHCTYVTKIGVTRGEWILVGGTVHGALDGCRKDNTHDVAGLFLAYDAGDDLLSGILAGTGTANRMPVWMPIVAVKVDGASQRILDLGELGDEEILERFGKISTDFVKDEMRLKNILEHSDYNPIVANSDLRRDFDGGRALIDPKMLVFCRNTIA